MSVSGAPRKHGNLVCARQKERQCGSLVSFDSNHRRTAAHGGGGRGGGCSLRSNRKLKVDVLETILNNFAVVTRTLLVIRDFLIARRVCKLTRHITTEANDLKEWLEVTFYALVLHDHIRGHTRTAFSRCVR